MNNIKTNKLNKITENGKKLEIVKVYRIFDQLYLNQAKAEKVEEDWFPKDRIQEGYSIFEEFDFEHVKEVGSVPSDGITVFDTQEEALEELWEEEIDLMGNQFSQYVYICNNDDCQEVHESQTDNCDSCNSDTREVHKGDIGLTENEGKEGKQND
jgi:hypothetical protein